MAISDHVSVCVYTESKFRGVNLNKIIEKYDEQWKYYFYEMCFEDDDEIDSFEIEPFLQRLVDDFGVEKIFEGYTNSLTTFEVEIDE